MHAIRSFSAGPCLHLTSQQRAGQKLSRVTLNPSPGSLQDPKQADTAQKSGRVQDMLINYVKK